MLHFLDTRLASVFLSKIPEFTLEDLQKLKPNTPEYNDAVVYMMTRNTIESQSHLEYTGFTEGLIMGLRGIVNDSDLRALLDQSFTENSIVYRTLYEKSCESYTENELHTTRNHHEYEM